MKNKFSLVLAICVMTALLAGTAGSTVWNAGTDFVGGTPGEPAALTASGMGANGAWSYGYDTNTSSGPFTFKAFPQWGYWVGGLWTYSDYDVTNPNRGCIGYTADENGSGFTNPPNSLIGFGEFANAANSPMIIRWTAPSDMTVVLSGFGTKVRTYELGYTFGVRKNSETDLWSETSADETDVRTFNGIYVNVVAGDVIDFWAAPVSAYDFFAYNITIETTLDTPTPTFNPPGGTYAFSKFVTISCLDTNATIYYTTDGSEPTTSSPTIASGSAVYVPTTTTLKAKAKAAVMPISNIVTATYIINNGGGSWDAATDFVPNHPPASGLGLDSVWSYGYDMDTSAGYSFRPFGEYGYHVGNQPSYNDVTFQGGFRGGISYVFDEFGSGFWNPANTLVGFGEMPFAATMPIIVRWTAPASINVDLSGYGMKVRDVTGWCPTYDFGVRKNSGPDMWTGTSANQTEMRSYNLTNISVERGDVIDLWAAPPTEYDFFALDSVVTSVGGERTPQPGISPAGGTFYAPQTVALTAVPGATIYYTTNGSEPTTGSATIASGSTIVVSSNMTLKAKAKHPSLDLSNTATTTFTFATPTPTFNPPGGTYAFSKYVTISCLDSSATIYYTTDGAEPTTGSPTIASGSAVYVPTTTTLKAKAKSPTQAISDTASATYTINNGGGSWDAATDFVQGTPPASGLGADGVWSYGYDTDTSAGGYSFRAFAQWSQQVGNFPSYNDVTFQGGYRGGVSYVSVVNGSGFTNPANTLVGFGEMPFAATMPIIVRWTAPASINVDLSGYGMKVRTVAGWCPTYTFGVRMNFGPDIWTETSTSETDVRSYNLTNISVERGDVIDLWAAPQVEYDFFALDSVVTSVGGERTPKPGIGPAGGGFFSPQTVTLTAIPGATIYYTTNGSEPTTGSATIASGSTIVVSSNMTLKAKAKHPSLDLSNTAVATYVIAPLMTIAEMKGLADNLTGGVQDVVVTAKFGTDMFYVEASDRFCGIQVRMTGNSAAVGTKVSVIGAMKTDSATGERYIDAASVIDGVAGSVAPIAMNNKALGGGASALQQGILDAAGLNNIGLFVIAYGTVSSPGASDFYLNDGSGVSVHVILPEGEAAPVSGFVTVTGVVSCEKVGGDMSRVIRATGPAVPVN